MVWRLGLLALCLFANSAAAETNSWHDPYFGKSWELTPNGTDVLLRFEPGLTSLERTAFATRESLTLLHAYNEAYGTAVYRRSGPESIDELVDRLTGGTEVESAAPVVIDQEGFTKYYVPGQLTVQFKKDLPDAICRGRISSVGSIVLHDYWTPGYYKIDLADEANLFEEIQRWNDSADVLFSEPVYMCYDDALYVPNDPLYPDQWGLDNPGTGEWLSTADVRGPEAWDVTRGDPNVLVVIIDTGLDMVHEDLAAQVIPRNGDDWDFATGGQIPDDFGNHGTACAGISVAIQDNDLGVSGIAPHCRLMPLKINLSSGQNGNRADAINYATSRRPEFDGLVMSNSWRMSSGDFTAVEAAVENAWAGDCIILFASGNGNSSQVSYPARYDGAIAVGATSPCDERKNPSSCDGENWGSDYGAQQEVMAPGVLITTTDRTGSDGYSSGDYTSSFNGTSSACPLAAGVAALIYSVNPNLSNAEVRQILQDSSDDEVGPPNEDSPGWDMFFGYGRVNARAAVDMAGIRETFDDDMESGEDLWTTSGTGFGVDSWHLDSRRNHTEGGSLSYRCGSLGESPYSSRINAFLISPAVQMTDHNQLSFWHYIDAAEQDATTALDGGRIEITSNGGSSWEVITPLGGYTHSWGDHPGQPFEFGDPVFSGTFDWRQEVVDLSSYLGETIQFRFHFGTRNLVAAGEGGEGWYIDDVVVETLDPASAPGTMSADGLLVSPNFPNPFQEVTEIEFRLEEASEVRVEVVDAAGRRVQSRQLGIHDRGLHQTTITATDDTGQPLPTGVYFYSVETSGGRFVHSMTVLRSASTAR